LALVLTIGAGLMIRSFERARAVDPGFNPSGVLTFRVSLPQTRYLNGDRARAAELLLLEQLRRVPGVTEVGAGTPLPMGEGWQITFTPQGPPLETLPLATNAFVLPGLLEALGVRVREGRAFTLHDDANAPRVVMVNKTMERRYYGGKAIGRQLKWGRSESNPWMTIIGVVDDVKHDRLDGDPQPSVYMPVLQQDTSLMSMYRFLSYAVRTANGSPPSMHALRDAIHTVDPQLSILAAAPMEALVGSSIAGRRFNALLLGLFSALGLVLAATGVYGLLQYSVLQRTREIGVRVAIGAGRANVMQLVIGEALRLSLIGVAFGVVGALAVTRMMRTLLFETSPVDGVSFAIGAGLLLLVSLVASYLPTKRALGIDPAVAMRAD
jgi:putative ABC transport system permease protein